MTVVPARECARGSRWVIEGIFVWGTAVWLERADLIVWLDLPWRVAATARLVREHEAKAVVLRSPRQVRRWRRAFARRRAERACDEPAAPH